MNIVVVIVVIHTVVLRVTVVILVHSIVMVSNARRLHHGWGSDHMGGGSMSVHRRRGIRIRLLLLLVKIMQHVGEVLLFVMRRRIRRGRGELLHGGLRLGGLVRWRCPEGLDPKFTRQMTGKPRHLGVFSRQNRVFSRHKQMSSPSGCVRIHRTAMRLDARGTLNGTSLDVHAVGRTLTQSHLHRTIHLIVAEVHIPDPEGLDICL